MVSMILLILLLVGAVAVWALLIAWDGHYRKVLAGDTSSRSSALPEEKKTELEERSLENISEDLLDHLHWTLSNTPAEERRHSRWVMGGDWYTDVIRLTDGQGRSVWNPSRSVTGPEILMSLPVDIRDGTGPPHLEIYEGPVELPPAVPDNGGYLIPQAVLSSVPVDRSLPSAARKGITGTEMSTWDMLTCRLNDLDSRLSVVARRIGNLKKMPAGYKENQLAGLQMQETWLRKERKKIWNELTEWNDRMTESLAPPGIITINEAWSREGIAKIRDMTIREFAEYRKAGYWDKAMVLPESAEYHPVPGTENDAYRNTMDYMDHQRMLHGQIPPPRVVGHNADEKESYRYALIERKIREHDNVCRQDLPADEKDEKRERIRQELEELTNHSGDAITYAITSSGK